MDRQSIRINGDLKRVYYKRRWPKINKYIGMIKRAKKEMKKSIIITKLIDNDEKAYYEIEVHK
ncbi:hypothetical protein IGI37_001710 [Enterococcus sp. AZ194]|uniref:hypothetical protein n=1 Tax=Enterococcus sp. AZ194 TaxID=2774629 RepID=UPI003F2033ED